MKITKHAEGTKHKYSRKTTGGHMKAGVQVRGWWRKSWRRQRQRGRVGVAGAKGGALTRGESREESFWGKENGYGSGILNHDRFKIAG